MYTILMDHNHTHHELSHDTPKINTSHDKHAGHHTEDFLRKFWVVLALTVPIVAYSDIFKIAFGVRPPAFPMDAFVLLALGSAVFFYGGGVFLLGAKRELQARLPGMMTLISLAIIAAYAFSIFQVFRGEEHTLLWELSTLIAVMLLGHWIEMKAVAGTAGALGELAKLLPDTAEVIRDNKTRVVPLSELVVGDTVLIKPGSKVPADGIIIEGASEINEALITGESQPVAKGVADRVIAGSVNGDGSIQVRITHSGERTFLAGIVRLVAEAQSSKSRLQILSDRAALWLTAIAIGAGSITLLAWMVVGGAGTVFAIERTVAVLVVACPHALGLAVPLVASLSTTMAAQNGFLVRQRLALETARAIDIVLFDKTGTLTQGEFGVDTVLVYGAASEEDVLHFAASVDARSEHPLARAIVDGARQRGIIPAPVTDFVRVAGRGAEAVLGNQRVAVGNDALLSERVRKNTEPAYRERVDELMRQGKTVVHIMVDNALVGSIVLADIIREESYQAVEELKGLGIKVAMITGDSEGVAAWVARELKLDQYFSRVEPSQKAEKVKELQAQKYRVAMVGDGINDAPALSQADLGVAIGAGTTVAIESAGIILIKNNPRDIAKIIHLSRLTYRKMLQNLFWATGYNVVALPLAAGAFAFAGIILQPALAAVLMSLSTVIVAINATMLRRERL